MQDGSRITFHDEDGICVNGARRAEYTLGEQKIAGCWKQVPGQPFLGVVFVDGDIAKVPIQAVRPPERS